MRKSLLAAAAAIAFAIPAASQSSDLTMTTRIMDEGFNRSQVMVTAEYLADQIGPRLTNSPAMRKAEAWTSGKFSEWGLSNVHKEGFEFGRGWTIDSSSVRMVSPRPIQLTAIPIAWTPGTNGVVSGEVVVAPMTSPADFARWRGKLRGKVVLVTRPDTGSEPGEAPFKRLSDDDIAKLDQFVQPTYDPAAADRGIKRLGFAKAMDAFLQEEGAVAYATKSRLDGKLVHGEGYLFGVGDTVKTPGVEIAAEDYRRLARLAGLGLAPTVSIDNRVTFDDSDVNAYDIIADIPGSAKDGSYVMAGAHLDSWVAGDGAADNGAGSAMIMEAARILSRLGVKPKRTIRFALWAGEEQGLLGSLAYVENHFATRGGPANATGLARYMGWGNRWPITTKPEWSKMAAYFNIDNGSGKLRGIFAENNPAVVPIFKDWLTPFESMGASSVVIRKTGGTDHVFMQAVGLPGFQFIQDPLDYESRIHHTSVDTFDHLKGDDMRQAAVILAAFLWNAANGDALPRPPIPTQPVKTDPFAYGDE
ncbi:MAG: M20/M25/M40 family metallo-hydrolase [Sphingomonas sp.]|uniref:M20/M25/M40 family metallo-hydrolase n=1 Tax=Sphingomonas sp. TaxID=28214 RepID=UPI0011F47231|nr:M20/M25/M40 family metallo-hydrolase [Sphingomonas sp.]THD37992.1 MAG: M20/M25/M40 family metallo-hydrolase [Sphingomonas sp.]